MEVSHLSCRLQFSVCGEGVIYSIRGGVKRRWRWGGAVEGEDSAFQPLSLSLNKQLSLQCSGRDQLLVTFSVSQQYVKFTIPRKLKDVRDTHTPPNIEDMFVKITPLRLQFQRTYQR